MYLYEQVLRLFAQDNKRQQNYRNVVSSERIINTDRYFLGKPIIKRVKIR